MNAKYLSRSLLCAAAMASLPAFAQKPPALEGAVVVVNAVPIRNLTPVYPYDLLVQGRTGWAEVQFTVEYSGRAILANPVGSSDALFAHSLVAEIESTEFMPPRRNGQPVLSTAQERFAFNAEASLDPVAKQILAELRKPKPAIYSVSELDKKPVVIRQSPPVYPYAAQSDGLSGQTEIEFIVDRSGRVLFPHILSSSNDDFGWAAASAISRWHFEPPTKGGQKVDARITIPVTFDYTKMAASW